MLSINFYDGRGKRDKNFSQGHLKKWTGLQSLEGTEKIFQIA